MSLHVLHKRPIFKRNMTLKFLKSLGKFKKHLKARNDRIDAEVKGQIPRQT